MGPSEWVTPQWHYTVGPAHVTSSFLFLTRGGAVSGEPADGVAQLAVARCADTKNSKAFAGICRLKSTRLWTNSPQHPTSPERFSAAPKDLPKSFKPRTDSIKSTARNHRQHRPPGIPVSARASR